VIAGLDFVSYPTRDMARSKAFYVDVLGLRMTTPPDDPWPEFDLGDGTILALLEPEKIGRPFVPAANGIALRVPDFAAAVAALEAKGIAFRHKMDSGVCQMAFFADPDGNALTLHHRYAPEENRAYQA
jgi:catechol 2,3-dioxygenase-like lactoylglutathione lyase family enzyme